MMFETNHDGSSNSGMKAWRKEKMAIYELIGSSPNVMPFSHVSQTSRLTREWWKQ